MITRMGILRPTGPARYVRVRETGGRLGFITPLTHNFARLIGTLGAGKPWALPRRGITRK
jgi:hypothetical protein